MIFIANSGAKSSKFRGKSKNFRKILMPTDLNLAFLKSMGGGLEPSLPIAGRQILPANA
jgi:hypothetical protein